MTILKLNYHLHIWMLNPIYRMAVLLIFCVLFQNNFVECSNIGTEDMINALEEENSLLIEDNQMLENAVAALLHERAYWREMSQEVIATLDTLSEDCEEIMAERDKVIAELHGSLNSMRVALERNEAVGKVWKDCYTAALQESAGIKITNTLLEKEVELRGAEIATLISDQNAKSLELARAQARR